MLEELYKFVKKHAHYRYVFLRTDDDPLNQKTLQFYTQKHQFKSLGNGVTPESKDKTYFIKDLKPIEAETTSDKVKKVVEGH